jgi:DNA-binding XRE family transcriptional regulator
MNALDFKNWREKLRLTQQQVADRLGVSRTTIQNWESDTPIPQSVEMSCKVWGHRIKQENPAIGPLTLVYSDGPMFIDPYGPRRRPAMMQQEPFPTNAAVLARVQQLAGGTNFYNPFVIEADHQPLWNAPELARVLQGEDSDAPTLANMLHKTAKAVRDDAANFVRSGPKSPTPAEKEARKKAIVAQADLLDKFAEGSLSEIAGNYLAVEKIFEQLRTLGTRAPDQLVSGIAFAVSVFDRYPLVQEDVITEEGNDRILHYKGYELRFPKIPIFPNKWTINLCSNDPRLFNKLGSRNIVIDGRTREEAIANAKTYVDELG